MTKLMEAVTEFEKKTADILHKAGLSSGEIKDLCATSRKAVVDRVQRIYSMVLEKDYLDEYWQPVRDNLEGIKNLKREQ